jgi:putative ABC transport system permease protein
MKNEGSSRRWSRIFRPDARAEVEDELAFHLERRVQENLARGMDPVTARQAAQERLGDLKGVRKECTDLLRSERKSEARREWLRFSWLDFKLGFRMLSKYPGLTVVGGMAIAFAILVGAVSFEFMMKLARPSLNLPDGDRIVALKLWNALESKIERRAAHDLTVWQNELKSINDLGAYVTVKRNLIGSDNIGLPVVAAGMTASGFRVAGVAPLMGRPLVEDDARPGVPPVIVLGEDLWRTRFESDPAIIGRVVRLGSAQHTVVGVMPKHFAFPMYHNAWIPLRLGMAEYQPLSGPAIQMFGRLNPGTTIEQAQTELTALGERTSASSPRTHRHLQPQLMAYGHTFLDAEPDAMLGAYFANSFMLIFMLLIYANVALLMFGRAATREGEIVVRNALGASRGRILMQLFSEALVLGAFGAMIGLFVAHRGLGWAFGFLKTNNIDLPFWFRQELSPVTVLYTVGLTVLAAVVAGVIPGFKATRGLGTQLRAASAAGGGIRFGGIWTVIIVTQVAFTVAFFPALIALGVNTFKARNVDLGVAGSEYLTLRFQRTDQAPAAGDTRSMSAMYEELKRRVAGEPGVKGVTLTEQFPGAMHPELSIEIEGLSSTSGEGIQFRAQRASVDPDFLSVMGVKPYAGRDFHSFDATSDAKVVIVNETFGRVFLGGRSPIGQRVRYLGRDPENPETLKPGPWFEIVGVVKDLTLSVNHRVGELNFSGKLQDQPGIYQPMTLDANANVGMAIHVDGNPLTFATRVHAIATAVDPTLRVDNILPLDGVSGGFLSAITFWFRILLFAGGLALLLSLAGIYSIMSFTVARRTREIGIRVALGSGRGKIMSAMFSRALTQIGIGVVAGVIVFVLLTPNSDGIGWLKSIKVAGQIVGYATVMTGVCMLACVVPARRALSVQPTDALRSEG